MKRYRRIKERIELGRTDKPPKDGTYSPPAPYRVFRLIAGGAAPREEASDPVASASCEKMP